MAEAETLRCPRCQKRTVFMQRDGAVITLSRTCCTRCGSDSMIIPRAGVPGATAADVVARLVQEYPRNDHSGTCHFCGCDMYDDPKNSTADYHAPDCVWAMANTAAGLAGRME